MSIGAIEVVITAGRGTFGGAGGPTNFLLISIGFSSIVFLVYYDYAEARYFIA